MSIIKSAFMIGISSLLLVGCSDTTSNTDDNSSSTRETELSESAEKAISFTDGVDQSGLSYTDSENYINIDGKVSKQEPIYVIYEGTVLDEITPKKDGSFRYHSKSNETTTMLVFSTDDLKFGKRGVSTKELNVAEVVNVIPNPEYIESKVAKGINAENPEQTANYIKEAFYPDSEVKLIQEEYANGIQDVYAVGEFISIILNDDKKIEQITFKNLEQEDALNILNDIDFPETSSINNFLDENKNYYATGYKNTSTFTHYEGIGVHLSTKSEEMKKIQGYNPFIMVLVYDEDRLDWFIENR